MNLFSTKKNHAQISVSRLKNTLIEQSFSNRTVNFIFNNIAWVIIKRSIKLQCHAADNIYA